VQTFARLRGVDPGFTAAGVLTLRVSLPQATYPDAPAVGRFLSAALPAIEALPGVRTADVVTELPLSGSYFRDGIAVEDFPLEPDDLPPIVAYVHTTPGYFETLGIPLLAGRPFEPDGEDGRNRSVVASEAFARRFWPGGNPLGKRLQRGGANPDGWAAIAGVVGDVRQQGLADPPVEILYFPIVGPAAGGGVARNLSFAVRSAADPAALAEPVSAAIWALDSELPISGVRTLEEVRVTSTARTTFAMTLLTIAAAVAVALGTVGLYGVVAYAVARRTREIGVRMALGADRGKVAAMVLGQGLAVIGTGLAVGLAGALALTRLLAGLLYGVSAADPATFAGVSLLLSAVGLAASWLPARRAAAVEPTEALGTE
jgi:predicted permease